jgi:SAM-dependent methyltransferase
MDNDASRMYWDAQPCNIHHGKSAVGTLNWSREVTHRKYFVEPHIPSFAQYNRWKGKHVLEIGCGIGTDTLEFLRAGAIVDALDLSHESIILARRRVELEIPAGLGRNVRFWESDAAQFLPYPVTGRYYDLIYSFGVLHHIANAIMVLARARDRLGEAGELRIMLYARWSLKHLLCEQPEAQSGCPYVQRYDRTRLKRMFKSSGLKIESFKRCYIFPWRVKDYVQHRYVKRWYLRHVPFKRLESALGDHLLIVGRISA